MVYREHTVASQVVASDVARVSALVLKEPDGSEYQFDLVGVFDGGQDASEHRVRYSCDREVVRQGEAFDGLRRHCLPLNPCPVH